MPISSPILETPRLVIRAACAIDLNDLMLINGDPEVTKFLPYATWSTLEDAAAWLTRMQAIQNSGSGIQLVIQKKENNQVIGTVLLFKHDEASSRIELGYVLARQNWSRGLMKEALSAVISNCFRAEEIRRIEAEVNPDNLASNHLLVSLGFSLEGRARKRWVAKGTTYDTNLYGLLASEWSNSSP